MIVTASEVANDSKRIIDRVLERGESAFVQRHGRTVVEIRRRAGVSREDFLERMSGLGFSARDSQELTQAMAAASEVFEDAGGD